ncbi:sensor histidine kinase [Paenibacillus sp. WLX2291]|uniref:sensor histidine kinase n=1 Tax=Paenibacillus sp. WLX2291 TaxID=3296934 RepID=UPI0039841233
MKKRGIVFKLFVVTSAVTIGIFALILLAQGLFFDKFYRTVKVHDLEQSMHTFGKQYAEQGDDPVAAARILGQFSNDNRAALAIYDTDLQRRSQDPYFITLQTKDKQVSLLFSSLGTTIGDVPPDLQIGATLKVDGIYMDQKDTIMQPSTLQPQTPNPDQGLTRIEGTITDLVLPQGQELSPFYTNTLVDNAFIAWRNTHPDADIQQLKVDNTVQSEWTDPWSGVTYAMIILPVTGSDGKTNYALSLSSLQPVGEASMLLQRYYLYLAPIIAVILLLLSFLYSRLLSRPLLQLSRTSARMARLDFQPMSNHSLRSNDEFGELSRNLDTLRHNLDAALRKLSETNEALSHEMEEKNRAEQLRKELIANISHELKTPLGIVKGFAEGLQDDVAADKRERYVQLIVTETDRMNALIMDMLQLSRFEVKAVKLKSQPIDIVRHIQALLYSFAPQLESRHLRVVTSGDETLWVNADPRRIDQVLLNLLSNAVRHTHESGTITVDWQVMNDEEVEIAIENEGDPIPAQDLERIWDQFYRAERSRDRKTGGTGLGLAIVKHIFELHESRYEVNNTENGVAFRFTLKQAPIDRETREIDE